MENSFVYQLQSSWTDTNATWLNTHTDSLWSTPGGDFDVLKQFKTPYASTGSWEEYDVTEIVQNWLAGSPNYGFIVFPDQKADNTGREYLSSEYSDDCSLRPKLTITYEGDVAITEMKTHKKCVPLDVQLEAGKLIIQSPFSQKATVFLVRTNGARVSHQAIERHENAIFQSCILAKGIYIVQVRSINNDFATTKILIP